MLPTLRLLLGLMGIAALSGCRPKTPPANHVTAAAPVLVRVAPIETSTRSPAIHVAGVLARQTESDLSFPVGGILERVLVRAGDRVTRNQELARLQLDQAEAQVVQASAVLEKARRDLVRIERLQTERVTTLENLQDARTQVEQASAALRIAEFNRRHSVIVAPTDGVILRRLAEPNEQVAAGRALLSFASEGEGWIVKASIGARDAARIAPGAPVELDAAVGGKATGKIVRLAEAADVATRTVPIEVALDNPPAGARSGLVVSMIITPGAVVERTVIPLAALQEGLGGRAVVFLVEPGATTAKRVEVELEQIDADRVYLRTPLPAGAQVIIAGGQFVREGAAIQIADGGRAVSR
jgi:membrane fusion protein, multidrug efflux system